MNQFRDLLICALVALAIALSIGHPENWTWDALGGPYVVTAISFLADTRPISVLLLFAGAVALFMTRLKY
jgi:hypothetical protein